MSDPSEIDHYNDPEKDYDEEVEDEEPDSSEEEEDDDEEELARVRDNFIVDDDEEEIEDTSMRRKKKKRRRKQRASPEVEERHRNDELEDDDLDLILENTGTVRSNEPRYKRLKRAGGDEGQRRGLTEMFSDEDEVEERGQPTIANEFDDFIEEDEFSDEERRRKEDYDVRATSRKAERRGGLPSVLSSELTGIDEDKLNEIYEVFGDGEEYDWALEAEDQMELASDEEEAEVKLKDVFEPGELKARLMTEEDNAIRVVDVPERYQLLRQACKMEYELSQEEFEEEQTWVAEKMAEEKTAFLESQPHLRPELTSAVRKVVEFISRQNLEVPFIWQNRKDYLVHYKTVPEGEEAQTKTTSEQLLTRDDLWRIVQLDLEFHGILEKKKTVKKIYTSMDTYDDVYEEFFKSSSTLVDFQDLMDYVQFKFSAQIRSQAANGGEQQIKRHSRFSKFERIRTSPVYELVEAFGLTAEQLAENVEAASRLNYCDDPAVPPLELAMKFTAKTEGSDKAPEYVEPEHALEDAEQMLAEEILYNPKLRRAIRKAFWEKAKVDIILTDKGHKKIDDGSSYYDFKYAINRTFDELRLKPELYLRMLQAETEGLVTVRVSYPDYKTTLFKTILDQYFTSDNVSDVATKWNEARGVILKMASRKFVPLIARNIKEDLKNDCQRALYFELRNSFAEKLDQAPYKPPGYVAGTTARVLAVSAGNGNFGRDAVLAVMVDEDGEIIEYGKFGDPRDQEFRTKFVDMVNNNKPDVIGMAGFTVNSSRLFTIIEDIIRTEQLTAGGRDVDEDEEEEEENGEGKEKQLLELIWVQDEIARLFQKSPQGIAEFSEHTPLSRYCIALARFVQSPLLEYASLGDQISAIHIHKKQYLLPADLFREAVESVFVDYVNLVGVEINEAVGSTYTGNLLPFVAGLGPRKAISIIQAIQSHGGSIANRQELITKNITTKNTFMNCVSFLKIPYERRSVQSEEIDVLDATRIHPEDYELSKKIVGDALEYDEEDIDEYESAGGVVAHMVSSKLTHKLNELSLAEFANKLYEEFHTKKLATLEIIRDEIKNHYEEKRRPLLRLTELQVFTMLTGETAESLYKGAVVPVSVKRVSGPVAFVRLACDVEGAIPTNMLSDSGERPYLTNGQTLQAIVKSIDYARFSAELSARPNEIEEAVYKQQHPRRDPKKWNMTAEEADRMKVVQKEQEQAKARRIVNHPKFVLMNSSQAEQYLAGQPIGDFVIRPSSRGYDHVAITWKVDNQVYQHIDVVEIDKENEYSAGRLQVDRYVYSDFDELIIEHLQPMVRKVHEMTSSDKYRTESRDQVDQFLTVYTESNAKRAAYAFTLDHKRPGYFQLCFKANDKAPVEHWPVKVIPKGFRLMQHEYPGVIELCNGFKMIYQNKAQEKRDRQNRHGVDPRYAAAPAAAPRDYPRPAAPASGYRYNRPATTKYGYRR
ncbi:transcription elongation factor Spt6p [Trichomonascus vanleenenianus]|uniref:chromatin-remodeling histone chaperone SPT6 n=1 Tax=Trichomonascus vanleenenianus TaxID=2268995 RepID=UPI003ECA5928